ncbi:phenylalanyl-tRNA synthetase beta subunit [Dongia mobilis]|uniref:Phenylalanine--tRNA ligase beta subunit n=1 Tax=Dongia mobilis TaxID=578943 RepID=A0A4R6WIT3_9PROT|nr:phenylalanine--tRNA ligase subunit beta [Dongia mobilis]TDQ78559.1 phenylalanyl-tRNA synthetase beta subunit [Dongia mobilis]
MKFTLSWLKTHLETDADLATISKKLTDLGLEVEGIEDKGESLKPFLVGYVIEAKQHPNADRLRVCKVDTGSGIVQVVCGAPNARTGMKGVFAPVGTHVPGTGLDLKAGKIRGEESNGMLCSARELGLGQDHDGIIELPEDAPVGQRFTEYRGLGDPVIEIKITPDRADCLGVFGIARDLASAGLGKLKPLDEKHHPGTFKSPIQWQIDESARTGVPYVAGRYFRGVKNGPSPQWLQDRLTSIGLRPISALVDITNFVTFDLCRPLHVFDADKVKGNVTMRAAKAGESILALDGKTYSLEPGMIVIADENGPEAIGGVMGGEISGCTETTTNVFLEAALFDPVSIAKTGRKLGIISDARYRNERGLDPQSEIWGVDVATRLILEICGGEASEITSAGTLPTALREIAFRPSRVRSLGGVEVATGRQKQILTDLGFKVDERDFDSWSVTVPSFRADVEGEADVVEEVMRVHGFDHIPALSMPRAGTMPPVAVSLTQKRVQQTKRLLAVRGLNETVTFSFMPSDVAAMFAGTHALVPLANPISADLDVMRPSILGNLLMAAARNAARGYADVALFEVGPTYLGQTPKDQVLAATGLRTGATPRHWQVKSRPLDAYDAKADAVAVLAAFGVPIDNLQIEASAPGYYHPGQSATLRLGPTILAQFGAIHPKVTEALDVKGPAIGFEVFLERLPAPRARGTARPLLNAASLQPLERDFAFIVDANVPAEKLVKAAKGADKALVTEVKLFDLFQGGSMPEGKKSLALSVTLQPREKTLTDAEIEAIGAKIVSAVNKATGGELRK